MKPDSSTAQRSRTTGHLVLTMPRVGAAGGGPYAQYLSLKGDICPPSITPVSVTGTNERPPRVSAVLLNLPLPHSDVSVRLKVKSK